VRIPCGDLNRDGAVNLLDVSDQRVYMNKETAPA
jgi:hypothetical protein